MKITIWIILLLFSAPLFGQVSGNVNYQNKVLFPENNINVGFNSSNEVIIGIKGLNNVRADSYLAVFTVSQFGKTTDEVNRLIDQKINAVKGFIGNSSETSIYLDMISFVPVYEYEIEKKIFSNDNYNEVPVGFELKKNLHIKYKDPDYLSDLITVCSKSGIYDLVKVDYLSENLSKEKAELSKSAIPLIKAKIQRFEELLNTDLDTLEKEITEGYRVFYPTEKYNSYKAYSDQPLKRKKYGKVKNTEKSTSLYYQPIVDKEFDFVINPIITEPVIQVLYEIKLKVKKEKQLGKNKYFIITPDGNMKEIDLKK